MTELSLVEDEPDEYEGRIVRWGGGEYVIGSWVATGAERIVHDLINRRSGLTLHIIKIMRDQATAQATSRALVESYAELRAHGIPVVEDPQIVHAHGGWFELDEAADLTRDPHATTMTDARRAFENGNDDLALSSCRAILSVNSNHTEALYLQARVAARAGDVDAAMRDGLAVISIEPNVRPYRFTVMESAALGGHVSVFLTLLEELQTKWPGDHRIDGLAAQVLLATGRPDKAAELHLPSTPEGDELRARIVREVKAAGRAQRHAARALDALDRDADAVLYHLDRARREYPTDPIIALNYGFALLRANRYSDAHDVIGQVLTVLPRLARHAGLTAMALALAALGDHARAGRLLGILARDLAGPDGSIAYWDLPAIPWWVDQERELMEPPDTAAPPIRRVLAALEGAHAPVPDGLRSMVAAYDAGAPARTS